MNGQQRKYKSDIQSVVFNNITYKDSSEMANIFNHHFFSVSSNVDQSIPYSSLFHSNPLNYLSSISN